MSNTSDEAHLDEGSDLEFADGDSAGEEPQKHQTWRILIVDDEAEIHKVTKLALRHFTFENRELEFFHAYSGAEARKLIAETPEIAVILLDVVMETEDAGLLVAKYIREELKNRLVRIILRTGQPGSAPEKEVIVNYEINEYKTKTELTSSRLFTSFVASLRNYRDLCTIDNHRSGLEKIIHASGSLFQMQSMEEFIAGILTQLTSLLHLEHDAVFCRTLCFASAEPEGELYVMAGTGRYSNCSRLRAAEVLPTNVVCDLQLAGEQRRSLYYDDRCIIYFFNNDGKSNMVYLEGEDTLEKIDKRLLDVFCANISVAIDNMNLKQEIADTQREVVYRMGAIGETRSKETGNHVKRVAEYSKLLALEYGLSPDDAELLKQASPMHDIGKVGIPDVVLNKPGKHTPEEWDIMRSHAQIGYDMLAGSNRPILRTAAMVALEHHEKWDGSGYPRNLAGEQIHIFGRITALADVFDALGSDRCYKKAWPLDQILDMLKREQGKHFDPDLVAVFLSNLDAILAIRDQLNDG